MAEHNLVAIATFKVTPEQAEAIQDGKGVFLPQDELAGIYAGCFTCEQVYEPGMENTECPGEPDGTPD